MRNSYWIAFAIITVLSGTQMKADSVLPANFSPPADLEATVSQVYEQSATFRAQCDRLAQAPGLRVNMRFDFNMNSRCRAFTIIRRGRGVLCAEVHLPAPSSQLAELIGHEFEHILEQVEHLDLRALARVRDSGVHEVAAEIFETDRAERTGKAVADEMRHRMPRPSAD